RQPIAASGDACVLDPTRRRRRYDAQASVPGQGFKRRVFPLRPADPKTAILGVMDGGVGLCCRRRGGRAKDGGASGNTAAGAAQAGADVGHRGARAASGEPRYLMTKVIAVCEADYASRASDGGLQWTTSR